MKRRVNLDCLADLLIDKNKTTELKEWLEQSLGQPKVLFLSGPKGSGKTTLVDRMTKALSVSKKESESLSIGGINTPQMKEKVKNWILTQCRMNSLFGGDWKNSVIVLDEEVETRWYVDVLIQFISESHIPVIFITVESRKNELWKCIRDLKDPKYMDMIKNIKFIQLNPITKRNIMTLFSDCNKKEREIIKNCEVTDLNQCELIKHAMRLSSNYKNVIQKDDTVTFLHNLGRVIHIEPKCEYDMITLKYYPSSIARELQNHQNILPLLLWNVTSTVNDLHNLTAIEHYISYADILNRLSFYNKEMMSVRYAMPFGAVMITDRKIKCQAVIHGSSVNQAAKLVLRDRSKIELCQSVFEDGINNEQNIMPINTD